MSVLFKLICLLRTVRDMSNKVLDMVKAMNAHIYLNKRPRHAAKVN
jgi:uncharacterized UPF0146 family protein